MGEIRNRTKASDNVFMSQLSGEISGNTDGMARKSLIRFLDLNERSELDMQDLQHWTDLWDAWGSPYLLQKQYNKVYVWKIDRSLTKDAYGRVQDEYKKNVQTLRRNNELKKTL